MATRAFGSDPLPGNGPWRILPGCPAMLHNTVRAATRGHEEHRCVCPRGRALAERDGWRHRLARRGRGAKPGYMETIVKPMRAEDALLAGALCSTDIGRAIVDEYLETSAEKTIGAARRHKEMCESCPVRRGCAARVLAYEKPGGAWGGIHAGMTAADRRAIWARNQGYRS